MRARSGIHLVAVALGITACVGDDEGATPPTGQAMAPILGADGGSTEDAGAAEFPQAEASQAEDAAADVDSREAGPGPAHASDERPVDDLPDFGAGECPAPPSWKPTDADKLAAGDCAPGQWRRLFLDDRGTPPDPATCVETTDVPADGAAFAAYVKDTLGQGGFAGYYTGDPPVFERRTTCAFGVFRFYADHPVEDIELGIRWTYQPR